MYKTGLPVAENDFGGRELAGSTHLEWLQNTSWQHPCCMSEPLWTPICMAVIPGFKAYHISSYSARGGELTTMKIGFVPGNILFITNSTIRFLPNQNGRNILSSEKFCWYILLFLFNWCYWVIFIGLFTTVNISACRFGSRHCCSVCDGLCFRLSITVQSLFGRTYSDILISFSAANTIQTLAELIEKCEMWVHWVNKNCQISWQRK